MRSQLQVPQQDRSRDKLERMYEVSVELLTQGGWDAVTVGEVERRSGVGRSTFYLRFANRESLIEYVRDRFLGTVADDQAAAFERARARAATTVEQALVAAVEAMEIIFRAHGAALMRIDRGDEVDANEVREEGAAAMNALSEQFRSVLEPVIGTTPAAVSAAQFTTQLAFSALVLEIQPRDTFPSHHPRTSREFLNELCAVLAFYLRNRIDLATDQSDEALPATAPLPPR